MKFCDRLLVLYCRNLLRRYKAKCVKTCCKKKGGGRSDWAKVAGERGRPWGIFLVSTKLDTFCYLTVQTALCYVPSFWHNTGMWQTDGRTDRQTDRIAVASTAVAKRALWRAVKNIYIHRVSKKNVPPSTCYNFDIHDPITIMFGRSVTQKVRNHTMLCFPTSPI